MCAMSPEAPELGDLPQFVAALERAKVEFTLEDGELRFPADAGTQERFYSICRELAPNKGCVCEEPAAAK